MGKSATFLRAKNGRPGGIAGTAVLSCIGFSLLLCTASSGRGVTSHYVCLFGVPKYLSVQNNFLIMFCKDDCKCFVKFYPDSMTKEGYPKTIILMHRAESSKKCSVAPLRGRMDLLFRRYPLNSPLTGLDGYVRLGIGGPVLSTEDSNCGLLLLDASWRHAGPMEKAVPELPVRGLPPLKTAYPRVSSQGTDPNGGLATVEALVAAYQILGRPWAGFLDHYHWKNEFLGLNANFFE